MATNKNTVANRLIRRTINAAEEAASILDYAEEFEAEEVVKDAFNDIVKELKFDIHNGKIVLEIIEKALLKLQWS